MTDRPSDRAIAQAVDEIAAKHGTFIHHGVLMRRAREIDATAPEGAQAVGEVCVHDSYRYARLYSGEDCDLPEGAKLYTTQPQDAAWKEAVESAVVVTECGPDDWNDPRKMIDHVINWHVGVALDPLVSEVARDREDAERYRWLKTATKTEYLIARGAFGLDDAAIDAARADGGVGDAAR